MHGINAVRRSSENITRQSVKAMEGLAGQSDLLRNVSENLLSQINSVTSRFENQGQMIMQAANSLEGANFKIDTTLRNRHAELSSTLDRLSGKAEEFGQFIEVYSSSIEGSISDAETRARGELERMRVETSAEGERALEDLKQRLTSVSSEMTSELSSLSNQVATSSEELRQQAARATEQVAAEQALLREQMEQLPITTQESTDTMRRALQDQLGALDQLSQLTSRTAMQRDVSPPQPIEGGTLAQGSQPPAGQPKPPRRETTRALNSLSSTITQEMGNRQRQQRPNPGGQKSGRGGGDAREGWSLGDLLARASRDEDGSPQTAGAAQPKQAFNLDLPAMARVLDAATAAAIWSRLRAGHRGVMARSIYGDEGRALFDQVNQRCQTDANLAQTISRYLADFERRIAEADLSDSSGRLTQSHLISDTGRVYLFLAHACGRLQ
jgi:predicted pyridoxine 5'-phosphate oxidase superfamily flavin-nucleotide-binding protein